MEVALRAWCSAAIKKEAKELSDAFNLRSLGQFRLTGDDSQAKREDAIASFDWYWSLSRLRR